MIKSNVKVVCIGENKYCIEGYVEGEMYSMKCITVDGEVYQKYVSKPYRIDSNWENSFDDFCKVDLTFDEDLSSIGILPFTFYYSSDFGSGVGGVNDILREEACRKYSICTNSGNWRIHYVELVAHAGHFKKCKLLGKDGIPNFYSGRLERRDNVFGMKGWVRIDLIKYGFGSTLWVYMDLKDYLSMDCPIYGKYNNDFKEVYGVNHPVTDQQKIDFLIKQINLIDDNDWRYRKIVA